MKIASFFAGAGGLDLGFEQAGFRNCFGIFRKLKYIVIPAQAGISL